MNPINYIGIFTSISVFITFMFSLLYFRRILGSKMKLIEDLQENVNRLNSVLATSMDAVIEMKQDGTVTSWSGEAEVIFGWSAIEAVGKYLHELIIPAELVNAHLDGMARYLLTREGTIMNKRVEITGLHRNGSIKPIELTISQHTFRNELLFIAFLRDISSRKKAAEQLFNLAYYDSITTLPNRLLFNDRLEQEIKKSKRTFNQVAVILLDLDHFKEVNDIMGHDAGDELLKEVAHRFKTCIRDCDTLARVGGDEFTLILPFKEDLSDVEGVAQKLLNSLNNPFLLKNSNPVYISASIGITIHPKDGGNLIDILKNADQAMYSAKKQGRNQFVNFSDNMKVQATEHAKLAADLRIAITEKQFTLVYQPIINLSSNKITKAEALIRWNHPIKGLISPLDFIPIAEETGLIVEIGEWVFQEAARQVKLWRHNYQSDFQISVNKSPIQFFNKGKIHRSWSDYLTSIDLPGQSIVIEITEGLLLDVSDNITGQLSDLRREGFTIAIDDFGTGYSSMSYLKKFEIDYLKIDKSFVSNLKVDSNDLALCEAMIVMAHKLGIKVIAEGVETAEECYLLSTAGCDFAQGYLFSKPVSPEEFEKLSLSFYD